MPLKVNRLGLDSMGDSGAGAGFRPSMLPSFAAWYDALDASTLTVDSSLRTSLWADKSGNSSTKALCITGTTSGYASFTALTAFGAGDFTVSARIRLGNVATLQWIFGGGTASAFSLKVDASAKLVASLLTVSDRTASASPVIQWADCVVTYIRSGGTGTYYINGVSAGTTADAINYLFGVSQVGASNAAASALGNIFWAHAYARALTGSEITNDAAGTTQTTPLLDVDFRTQSKLAASFTAGTGGTVTINTTGDTGARISGERDLYQGTPTKRPVYLAWAATNYCYLRGALNDYLSTPDSVALSVTGDITIDYYGTVENDTTSPALVFKDNTTVSSYRLRMVSGGTLRFTYSVDGSLLIDKDSSISLSVPSAAALWMRATRNSTTGDVKFYTGGTGAVPVWVQLGTTVAGSAGSMFDSNVALAIGVASGGVAVPLKSRFYRARIYNGFDGAGTLVFDFDPARYTSGTTVTEGSTNAAVVTINGGATVVTRSCLYGDGASQYMATPSFLLSQPETVYFVGQQVSWAGNRDIYDGFAASSMVLQQTAAGASPNVFIFAGANGPATNAWTLQLGAVIAAIFNGASSFFRVNRATAVGGNAGALSSSGLALFAQASGGVPTNVTASEIAIYAAAHDTGAQNRVALYAGRKWGISV